MRLIDFLADRVSAYFYRKRYERRQRRNAKCAAWLFVVLCGCAGCVPGGGPGAVVAAVGALASVFLAVVFGVVSDTNRDRIAGRVAVVLALVAAGLVIGCAPFHARRAIATIHDECEAAYRGASSEAEIEAIHERCDQRLEAIRHE